VKESRTVVALGGELRRGTTRGKRRLWDDEYAYGLDYGDSTGACMSSLIKLYALNMCSLFYVNSDFIKSC
jgi:hypothetical protein